MRNEAMDDFVARVREASDIVQVISTYVQLKRRGNRYWGLCPFHHEKTPSFSVVADQGFFYCFGCHQGGDAFKFLSLMENVSYFEAIKRQAELCHIPLPARERTPEQIARDKKREDLRRVHALALRFFHNCLTQTNYGKPALDYLARRGIGSEIIEAYSIGYAPPSWDKLLVAFTKRGVPANLLVESGLVGRTDVSNRLYDRFRGRVMIPIKDERGRVVAFGGRILFEQAHEAKYLNSPETLIFNKRRLLFGMDRAHRAMRQQGYAVLVEGYMDVISLASHGVENVVASLGTALTPDQWKLLMRHVQEIRLCYDSDNAGQEATLRALSLMEEKNVELKVARVPDGKDPDEYIRKHGQVAFQKVLDAAKTYIDFRFDRVLETADLRTLPGRLAALHALLPILHTVQDAVKRNNYVKRAAQALTFNEGDIYAELNRTPNARHVLPPPDAVEVEENGAPMRAGRIIIQWLLRHQRALPLALEKLKPIFFEPTQRPIFEAIQKLHRAGKVVRSSSLDRILREDGAEASINELSRTMVEDGDPREEAHHEEIINEEVFRDSIKRLRREYYEMRYAETARRVDELTKGGESSKALMQELEKLQRIKRDKDMEV